MVEKFGIEWMDTLSPIWKEYHFALDQETHLYSLDSPLEAPHQYGLFRALEQGLIIIRRGRASLNIDVLPTDLEMLHRNYERNRAVIENIWDHTDILTQQLKMFKEIGITSPDLISFVSDVNLMLQTGYDPRNLYH